MPRYPGGDYYLPPGTTAAPDTTIQSTPYNTFTADVETELNRQIDKDADQDAALTSGLASINASTVSFAPAGDIAATNVQAAIVEVDTEMHAADTTLTTAVGTAQTTANNAAAAAASANTNANNRVLKAGDTMTGPLVMNLGGTAIRQTPSGGSTGYGVMYYTDATNHYYLLTNNNDALGGFNGLRPFNINLSNGNVALGHELGVGGSVTVAGGVNSTGSVVTSGGNFHLSSGHSLYFEGSNVVRMWWDGSIHCSHQVYVDGSVTATGSLNSTGVSSSGTVSVSSATAFACTGYANSNPYIVVALKFNPNWGSMELQGLHYPGVWAGMNFALTGDSSTFSFRNGGTAFKSGGAPNWDGYSDARIKDVKADYTNGLDAIAALRPVRYVYKGNETYVAPSDYPDTEQPKPEQQGEPTLPYANSPNYGSARDQREYIGLLAQEAETVMPELFTQSKMYIDGVQVDDFRNVNYSALTFALVNAVKELKAEVDALKARLP